MSDMAIWRQLIFSSQRQSQCVPIYCFAMAEVMYHAVVWIGVVGVVPQRGCELLAPNWNAM